MKSQEVITAGAAQQRLMEYLADGARHLVGIVGPPGVGKSTFVDTVRARFDEIAVLPMDGFHLAERELVRLGRAARKGAPDTFDSGGYLNTLRRIRSGENVYAPTFDRSIEEPIAGAIVIPASASVVLTEGNYLLLPDEPWRQVREALDHVWYLQLSDETRRERLIARHQRFGRSPHEAKAWCDQVDEPNARLIASTRERAEVIVTLDCDRLVFHQ